MSQDQGTIIEDPNPAVECVAALNARWNRLRFRQKDEEGFMYDENVDFEKGFYRVRLTWLPKNGVLKLICRWPLMMPAANFGKLALAVGRINFGVRVGKFEFDERDGEMCLRHSFILGDKYKQLTTIEQRNTLYQNMFVLSHEMMENHWDTFAKLCAVHDDDDESDDEEEKEANSLIVADDAINEGEDMAEGTLGNVARATLKGSEERCVTKHLTARKNFTEEDKQQLKKETIEASKLFHPNLVPLRAVCADAPQIVVPFYEKGNLEKVLEENKATRLPASRVYSILLDVARAANYLHECGVTHGRIKPTNVLFDDSGKALLSDVGFTQTRKVILDGQTGPGEKGALYAAPEVLFGKPTSAGTDVFAIGIILFQFVMPKAELLPPVVPELISFDADVPEPVVKLIRDCLNRDATKRPALFDVIVSLKQLLVAAQ